jgi:hypothetical protein
MTFLHYKRREFTFTEAGFWGVLALVFATVAIFPGILDPIVESLHLARTMDFFVILGFMFLIFAVYYTYTVVRNNQRKVEEIVRKIALEKKK